MQASLAGGVTLGACLWAYYRFGPQWRYARRMRDIDGLRCGGMLLQLSCARPSSTAAALVRRRPCCRIMVRCRPNSIFSPAQLLPLHNNAATCWSTIWTTWET